jgi:hypothetical protein
MPVSKADYVASLVGVSRIYVRKENKKEGRDFKRAERQN